VTAKQIAEKRYVVKLSDEEREWLNTLIRAGKHPARQLTKARILLKADVSETGGGWRDCEIAAALDTSVDTVARTRQQLVEEGFDGDSQLPGWHCDWCETGFVRRTSGQRPHWACLRTRCQQIY
jgi:hypothetical protein